jgi:ribosomal protein L9
MFSFKVYATKENLAKLGHIKKEGSAASTATVRESNERLAELLRRIAPLQFPRAVAPSGSLFGSVTEADVRLFVSKSLQLSEEHLVIEMPKPVKEVGKHIVNINGIACEIEVTTASA